MATKPRTKKATPDIENMGPEEYAAYRDKVNREAPNELERRRRLIEITKRRASQRDVGDFDSTATLRLMRDGKIDY